MLPVEIHISWFEPLVYGPPPAQAGTFKFWLRPSAKSGSGSDLSKSWFRRSRFLPRNPDSKLSLLYFPTVHFSTSLPPVIAVAGVTTLSLNIL